MKFKCLGTGSDGNCYLAKINDKNYILDCGISKEKILKAINLNDVDCCFVTHKHKDHSAQKEFLQKAGIPIVDGETIKEFTKVDLSWNSAFVYAVPVKHDSDANCCAFIIWDGSECILYATDFYACEWDLRDFPFTSVIVECNYIEKNITQAMLNDPKFKRQINTHLGLEGLEVFLDKLNRVNLEEIIICHRSTSNGLFTEAIATASLYARYGVPIGCCKRLGGIEWTGKGVKEYE